MSQGIRRRELLRSTAALGVGFWLGTERSSARPLPPSEKLNVACIGVGGRGGANLQGVAGENVVALCDVDDAMAAKAFEAHPQARRFRDFRRMLDAMEGEIDAVVVSTPDHTHFHPAMMAMRRGLHCYCEKPMAHSAWEVRRMCETAAETEVATQLGVQRHTIANVHRVVELIRGGAIGEVREVHSWIDSARGMPEPPTGFPEPPETLDWDLWVGPAAMRPYSPAYAPYKWRFWWDFGTGETGNWGCHILDIPFWALGLGHPTRIDAEGPEVDPQRTPTSMSTRLRFAADGDRPAVSLHWYQAPGGPPVLKQKGLDGAGANNLFIGSEGMLLCGFNSRKLLPEEKFEGYRAPTEGTIPDSPGFIAEWLSACKGGPPATCDFTGQAGILAEAVILANTAYQAGDGFDWDAASLTASGNPAAQRLIRAPYREGWDI